VKEKGSAASTNTRTEEETQMARFFADAPANYWNRLMRDLVVSQSLDLVDSARMFALVSMVTADSVIASWDTKIAYNFWRPVTAIRAGEDDGNPKTEGDPLWTSFFNAPNYPDYTSGANNAAAAATTTLPRPADALMPRADCGGRSRDFVGRIALRPARSKRPSR
jgi:hypothetical protein